MTSSAAGRVVESSSGSPAISVVVTTIPTNTSQTAYVDPIGSNTAQHPFSQIKLVGVGGLERQHYCCDHWFPTSKSYHRHLAEKAFSDTSHEAKLLDLGMVRCTHCSMWVHSENIVAHHAKSHGNNKQAKTSKVIPVSTIAGMSGLGRESLMGGTNIVIKVAGQNAARSFSTVNSKTHVSPLASSGTVKLVSTSTSNLYQKLQKINHSTDIGSEKVIVRKSISNTSPMVNVGPRLVMKSVRQGVVPLGRNHKMLQQVTHSNLSPVTSINRVPLATTFKGTKISPSGLPAASKETPFKPVVSQSNLHKISGKNLKLVKKGTPVVPKAKSVTTNSHKNPELSESTKNKEKNKPLSIGDASSRKVQQTKKRRKQVLKPSASDVSYTDTVTAPTPDPPPPPPPVEGRTRLRKKKTKLLSSGERNTSNPPPNHKGHRRKLKEAHDSYTPKMGKRPSRGIRGSWNKKKRRPGRPRKSQSEETPDTSDTDSLFGETNKEDLENEPVVVAAAAAAAKKEEENIPTVELDLFTLPSTNEQVSVLLTEPQNPNFKVYASMDAIFVGDSALGDVTNQIGYVTDANNVVYVNPSHFLFPNVEDLENFVPSPILTMKGNKAGATPPRKTWTLNNNKAYPHIILKHAGVSGPRDAVSSGTSLEKASNEEGESHISVSSTKPKVEDHVLKTTQSGNTVLVAQERKSTPKKKPKPMQASNSLEPEAKMVTKESQKSTTEPVVTLANGSKKRSHKKKKSVSESSSEKGVKNSSVSIKSINESSPLVGSASTSSPVHVPPKSTTSVKLRENGEVMNKEHPVPIDSLIQKCVVKIEELKYPHKYEKPAPLSPKLSCDDEEVKTSADTSLEVSQTLSPVKTVEESVEESVPHEEAPVDSSVLQVVSEDKTSQAVPEETSTLLPSVEKSDAPPAAPPAEDAVADEEDIKPPESVNVTPETNPSAPVTEESKVLCRTVGGGLPRRMRRRRLRTKSANIVSLITDSMQEVSNGHNRRVRHVSENSSLKNTEVVEQKRVLVNSKNERTGSGHSPKRKCEKVSVSDSENLVDNIVPKEASDSPQSTTQLPSITPEKILSESAVTLSNTTPPSAGKGVKKHKSKHESKVKTPKVESHSTEMTLPIDVSGEVCKKEPSEEVDVEEKPLQARSVRERRPSFKLLESISVASQSPKRLLQTKVEDPVTPSEHSIDKLESTQPSENGSVSPITVDTSPSREWRGRGAKLKAQVLIQDQQAGVMDSHIYPPNDSLTSSTFTSITEPLSPKLIPQSPPKTPHTVTAKTPPSPHTVIAKTPSPSSSSKAFKSPTTLQNREWQARGAKLKAQVMISDPLSSLVPYVDSEEISKPLTSPPAKKIKLDSSPTYTKDIRYYIKQHQSQAPEETARKPSSPVTLHSPKSPHATKAIKQEKNTSDIRSYFKSVSPLTKPKKEKEEPLKENECTPPKELASRLSTENSQECSSMKDLQSIKPIPVSECSFEGFARLRRQSALRSKALLRLSSLLHTKRWYCVDRFPFPVDQLCDWDDELLQALSN